MSRTSTPPAIDLLIRFDTWYPWPVNILHHFVLPPNPSFSPAAFALDLTSDAPQGLPYLTPAAGAPLMAHAISSPLRLFTPSDMVLAPSGTALWLDASTDSATPSQAGDHGQRIAGRVLPAPAPPREGEGEGARWWGEGGGPMVFHMQEEDDGWNRLALDEEEGRVAVGTVYGRVHLIEYAPLGGGVAVRA